jgi:hypothetical protein
MKRSLSWRPARNLAVSLLCLAAMSSFVRAQEKAAVPAGGAVNVTVAAAGTPPPPVSIILHERHGHVTPNKRKCAHSGGGLIEVISPTPDTVLISMSGSVLANSEMRFDLEQLFEISFDDPKLKRAKLSLEGRVIGLLRGGLGGCAEYTDASAQVSAGPVPLLGVCVPPHNACNNASLAVNDHDGPKTVPVMPGKYTWHQSFAIAAHSDRYLCNRPSAEFAPDPAVDPIWLSYHEPFHGIRKDTFGFQVILKVAPDTEPANGDKKGIEKLPPPDKEVPGPAEPMPDR